MDLEHKTRIVFTQTARTVRAEIKLKRNDANMNAHCRMIVENWRANIDIQVILDQQAAINYMVKYVSKGKK
jgi:hypothetical protein